MLEAMVLSSPASRVDEVLHDIFEFWPVKIMGVSGLFLTLARRDCPLLGEWQCRQCAVERVLTSPGEAPEAGTKLFWSRVAAEDGICLATGLAWAFVPGLQGTPGAGAHQDFAQGQRKP